MSADEIGQITNILDTKSIPHNVIGDRVMVPSDRKMEVLAELGFSQALPRNFDSAFDDMIKQSTWIDSPDKSDRMFLEAKQRTLAMVISNFPGVASAVVVIDPTDERRFDDTAIQPSAMVMVTTRGGRASPRQLAESAADVVSGSQAGLLRSRINVVIDGAPFNVQDHNDDSLNGGSGGVIDLVRQNETFYRDKIREHFEFIRGIMVSVTVKLDTRSSVTVKHTVDPKTTVQLPTKTDEQTSESSAQQASATGEAGAVPNVGAAIGGNGSGGGSTSTSDSKSEFYTDNSKEDQTIKQGPGEATVVAASVRVPRSYFINQCKLKNNGKDPDDAALTSFTDTELAHIRQDVKACTGIAADDAVVVGSYSDDMPTEAAAAVPAASASTNFTNLLSNHMKEVAVGALALLSLFMMSMMVRKSGGVPQPVAAASSSLADANQDQTLQVGERIIGQVGEGSGTLQAIELDEETVKAQQVVEQVTSLVESNPDAAANLVKRWLNRT
jgi:flagellar biosynthesis/type III secretory pathway M-ring protein FliF/YscJ